MIALEAIDVVRAIVRDAEAEQYRISAFVRGVVASDAFRYRSAELSTTEVSGVHED